MAKKVAIIGGGITGLAAAFYLQRKITDEKVNLQYTLYESSSRLGGKIKTDYTAGNIMELGPDAILERKEAGVQLAKDVGLADDIVHNSQGQSYIVHQASLHPIPKGTSMGVPTQWGQFMKSSLLSPMGKVRTAADIFLPRVIKDDEDVALGTFFRERLGNEIVDRLIEPLLSGVYVANIDHLSLRATFPQYEQMEKKYRSLILGMKAATPNLNSKDKQIPSLAAKPKGMFISLKNGLESLVDAIELKLDKGTVKRNSMLVKIEKQGEQYHLQFDNGQTDVVDSLIIATPHHVTYKLFQEFEFANFFKRIQSNSLATVVLAFPKCSIKQDIDGSGFIVPSNSTFSITACTWTHKKWAHSAKDRYALLRAYVGGAYDKEIISRSDEDIVEIVLKDLNTLMKIKGNPEFYKVTRWKNAMPQYNVGHVDRLKALYKAMDKEFPGVFLAGSSYEGVGIPDCIAQGKRAVEKVIASL